MSEEAIQDTGSQEAAPEAVVAQAAPETAPVGFLESLPEELRNEPSLRNFADPGALAKSYVHAQRMIGADKVAIPGKSATPEEWREVFTKLGAPQEANAYEFPESEVSVSDDLVGNFRQRALTAGLTNAQANEMMGFVRDTISGLENDMTETTEKALYEGEQELRQEFGQAFEQRVELAQMAARDLLGDTEIFDQITLSDGRMLGDHPMVVKMFSHLAEQIGEDNLEGAPSELIMTPQEAQRQISEMTRRDGPYWDKMHPEHDTYIQEVLRLREYV